MPYNGPRAAVFPRLLRAQQIGGGTYDAAENVAGGHVVARPSI